MPKIAIIGSGPSGLFLSKNLLKLFKNDIKIDVFEKLSAPLGLLKFGVAPDHPEVKRKFMDHFEPVFDSSNVDIYLNAEIGNSPKIYELSRHYDAIVMCTGMSDSRRNWTEAQNSFGADEIFGWYNRNPKFLTLGCDLSKVKHLVIIGNGNVALDMARIFSKNPSQLSTDSLDPDVFKVLEKSDITDITILGRRDITKASFTPAELREFKILSYYCKISAFPESSEYETQNLSRIQTKNIQIMKDLVYSSKQSTSEKRINFRFSTTTVELAQENGLGIMKIQNSDSSNIEFIYYDLLIECTGFKQNQIFERTLQDDNGKFITTDLFRVKDNIYACGWSRTGPKGNIADSIEEASNCASAIYQDLTTLPQREFVARPILNKTIYAHSFEK